MLQVVWDLKQLALTVSHSWQHTVASMLKLPCRNVISREQTGNSMPLHAMKGAVPYLHDIVGLLSLSKSYIGFQLTIYMVILTTNSLDVLVSGEEVSLETGRRPFHGSATYTEGASSC